MSDINWNLAPEGTVALKMVTDGGRTRWFNKDGKYFSGSGWLNPMYEYVTIATRPQQKTVADAQEGEKWTHRTNAGELCNIHVKEPDVNGVIIVINERGEYLRHNSDSLKPIKPKLTKAEAWDRCMEEFGVRNIKYVMQELMDEFDII